MAEEAGPVPSLLAPLAEADEISFFEKLLSRHRVEGLAVRRIDERVGKGLFATRRAIICFVPPSHSRRLNPVAGCCSCTRCSFVLEMEGMKYKGPAQGL